MRSISLISALLIGFVVLPANAVTVMKGQAIVFTKENHKETRFHPGEKVRCVLDNHPDGSVIGRLQAVEQHAIKIDGKWYPVHKIRTLSTRANVVDAILGLGILAASGTFILAPLIRVFGQAGSLFVVMGFVLTGCSLVLLARWVWRKRVRPAKRKYTVRIERSQ